MAGSTRLLTFSVGDGLFALESSAIAEVVPTPPLTRVPQAPAALRGLANVRGRVTPILALDGLLEQADPVREGRQVIVLGDPALGLVVDRVRGMGEADVRDDEDAAAQLVETGEGPARLLRPDVLLATRLGGWTPRRRAAAAVGAAPTVASTASDQVAFLEIHLDSQAYAVPLEEVREAFQVPASLQSLPGSDTAMVGLVEMRERLLPVVSAASVLGLRARALDAHARIVVVAVGEAEVGLLVDGVRGVLRVARDRLSATPAILNRAAGEARIESIVRAGDRLVSILPAARLLDEATVAMLLSEGAGQARDATDGDDEGAMQRFVLFRLGRETYGLPIEDVEAVIRLPQQVSRVPGAPPFVAGIVSHRGRALPLIDQAARFASANDGKAAGRRVLVTRIGDMAVGFIVDAVDQIAALPESQLQPAPDVAAGEDRVFDRVASFESGGRLVLLVDARRLLDQTERSLLQALAERAAAGA